MEARGDWHAQLSKILSELLLTTGRKRKLASALLFSLSEDADRSPPPAHMASCAAFASSLRAPLVAHVCSTCSVTGMDLLARLDGEMLRTSAVVSQFKSDTPLWRALHPSETVQVVRNAVRSWVARRDDAGRVEEAVATALTHGTGRALRTVLELLWGGGHSTLTTRDVTVALQALHVDAHRSRLLDTWRNVVQEEEQSESEPEPVQVVKRARPAKRSYVEAEAAWSSSRLTAVQVAAQDALKFMALGSGGGGSGWMRLLNLDPSMALGDALATAATVQVTPVSQVLQWSSSRLTSGVAPPHSDASVPLIARARLEAADVALLDAVIDVAFKSSTAAAGVQVVAPGRAAVKTRRSSVDMRIYKSPGED